MTHDINEALPYLRAYHETKNPIHLGIGADHMEELGDPRHIFLRMAHQLLEAGHPHTPHLSWDAAGHQSLLHGKMLPDVDSFVKPGTAESQYFLPHRMYLHDPERKRIHALIVPLRSHEAESLHEIPGHTEFTQEMHASRTGREPIQGNEYSMLRHGYNERGIHPKHDELNDLKHFGVS